MRLLNLLNPKHPSGKYWLPDAVIGLVMLVIGLSVGEIHGYNRGVNYNASYYAAHFNIHTQPHPPVGLHVPIAFVGPPPQNHASVDFAYLPPPGDQGNVGQCQCVAFAKQYAYLFDRKTGNKTQFSCRYWYSLIWGQKDGFKDNGSIIDDYTGLLSQYGAVPTRFFPYTGRATDSQLKYPIPANIAAIALKHRYSIQTVPIAINEGGGQATINGVEQQIATNKRPVNLGLPVFNNAEGLFNANNNKGFVDEPTGGSTLLGYHAMTIVAYNRHLCHTFSHGQVCGFFLISNQWGPCYGVNQYGQFHLCSGGYVWVSMRMVADDGFFVEALKLSHIRPSLARQPIYLPNNNTLPPVPSYIKNAPRKTGSTSSGRTWYVHNVILTTGQDVSPIINSLGDQFHVMPVAIAATVGTESGFNPNAERFQGGLDDSCGLLQEILANVTQLNGLYGMAACRWEENPYNSLWFGTKILAEDQYTHPSVPFPNAYVFYNAGNGTSDSEAIWPSGQAAQNLYQNFIPNWNYALSHFAYYASPPKPFTFPYTSYQEYRDQHRLRRIVPFIHHGLTWEASIWVKNQSLRGVRYQGNYLYRQHIMKYGYRCGTAYGWLKYGTYKVVHTRCVS